MTTASKFGAWSAPQSKLEIEYSLVVLEEIRQCVTDGFQRLRGGMEVGGVLFGTRQEGKLRLDDPAEQYIPARHSEFTWHGSRNPGMIPPDPASGPSHD